MPTDPLTQCSCASRASSLLSLQPHTRTSTTRSCPPLGNLCTTHTSPPHAGHPSGHWSPTDSRIRADLRVIRTSRNSATNGYSNTISRIPTVHSWNESIHRTYSQWVQEKLFVECDIPTGEEPGRERNIYGAVGGSRTGPRGRSSHHGQRVS
jgi:hypothetical protein